MTSRSLPSARRLLADAVKITLACAIGILIFDACVYAFGPRSLMAALPEYKRPLNPEILSVAGRGSYPRDYFVPDPETGFDVAPNRRAKHFVPDFGVYEIWSNEIGCFDSPVPREAEVEQMIYLAGDSFTWGYAPFDRKFGQILAEQADAPVLKCGVTHSGQRHQFLKFKQIVRDLGAYPGTVVVNYVANDVANDFSFPHTTVIDGWQVDNRGLDRDNRIVDIPESELRARMTALLAESGAGKPSLRATVMHYSAAAGLMDLLWTGLAPPDRSARRRGANGQPPLRGIYALTRGPHHEFASELAERNRAAIRAWQADSISNAYRLVFALIPPKGHARDTGYYRDLKSFLSEHGVEYYDFAESTEVAAAASADDFYWQIDGHFSVAGNAAYADFLRRALQDGDR